MHSPLAGYNEAERLLAEGVDIITGGFPCQDISTAGKGAGIQYDKSTGEAHTRSGLFGQLVRTIRLVRPRYALLENVAALLSRGMGTVLGDLAEIGYDTEWHCISAADVGAPHLRERTWIIANPQSIGVEGNRPDREQVAPASIGQALLGCGGAGKDGRKWETEPALCRVDDGFPFWVDRIKGLGNAIVPQIAEIIGKGINQ